MNQIIPSEIYVYTRVSTRAQAIGNNGLKNQRELCDNYIKTNKLEKFPIKYYSDIGSSYNDKNILINLNKMIKKIFPRTLILIGDISRLGRNSFQVFSVLRKIKQKNSYIFSVDDNLTFGLDRFTDKKFYHKIIDAEYSSDMKSEKTTNRINFIKKNKGYIGNKPMYGKKILKKNNIPYICKNDEEVNIIRIMKLKYNKTLDFNGVAEYLNKKKLFNRGNIEWTNLDVKKILLKNYPTLQIKSKIKNKNTNNLIDSDDEFNKNIDLLEISD